MEQTAIKGVLAKWHDWITQVFVTAWVLNIVIALWIVVRQHVCH
jgi:hypothetical protein